jgi:membrane-anchored protein YejM (alkaline phosphatase superfamily)
MQKTAGKEQWSNRFDEIDGDRQLKQVLDTLKNENSLLKTLVVRLSETIIRNAVAKSYKASATATRYRAAAKSN